MTMHSLDPLNFALQGFRERLSELVLKTAMTRIIQHGTLALQLPDGRTLNFGNGGPVVAAKIQDWRTLRRLALNHDLALGEYYMDGTLIVTQGDIYDLLALCLANIGLGYGHWFRQMQHRLRWLGRRFMMHNPIGRAQQNVAHHYNLSDDLYDLFLDAERQYSCALYETSEDSLENAQARKMRHIAAKLRMKEGAKVLDIGSGWGGLALFLARATGADVTGVTLSVDQQHYAEARAASEGLSNDVRFRLKDYRLESGRYDRIVSVGMFEHVGVGHYREYFSKLDDLLTDDGVVLIHTIGNVGEASAPHPWIRKYIFPGGYIPSLSEITPEIEKSGLILSDLEILRLHYAETLKAWRERFMANRDKVVEIYDERFCRMWEFYLAASEAGFRYSGLVVFQFQLAKKMTTLPVTRDYIATERNRLMTQPCETASIATRVR
jgi:cyclopropane-fatty-acyl-phospholipid synthase